MTAVVRGNDRRKVAGAELALLQRGALLPAKELREQSVQLRRGIIRMGSFIPSAHGSVTSIGGGGEQ